MNRTHSPSLSPPPPPHARYFHPYMAARVMRTEMPPGLRRWAWVQGVAAALWLETRLAGSRAETYWANMLRLGWGKPQLFLYRCAELPAGCVCVQSEQYSRLWCIPGGGL